jgi:hypothetical protein
MPRSYEKPQRWSMVYEEIQILKEQTLKSPPTRDQSPELDPPLSSDVIYSYTRVVSNSYDYVILQYTWYHKYIL